MATHTEVLERARLLNVRKGGLQLLELDVNFLLGLLRLRNL